LRANLATQLGDAWHQDHRRVGRVPQPAQLQAIEGSSADHRSSPIHLPTPLRTSAPGAEASPYESQNRRLQRRIVVVTRHWLSADHNTPGISSSRMAHY